MVEEKHFKFQMHAFEQRSCEFENMYHKYTEKKAMAHFKMVTIFFLNPQWINFIFLWSVFHSILSLPNGEWSRKLELDLQLDFRLEGALFFFLIKRLIKNPPSKSVWRVLFNYRRIRIHQVQNFLSTFFLVNTFFINFNTRICVDGKEFEC